MQECCSESLGTLVRVAQLAGALKVGSGFQRFGSSSGSRPGKRDEERCRVLSHEDGNKQF